MTGLNFAGGSEFAAIQLWAATPHHPAGRLEAARAESGHGRSVAGGSDVFIRFV